jgi:hypothetical protein
MRYDQAGPLGALTWLVTVAVCVGAERAVRYLRR